MNRLPKKTLAMRAGYPCSQPARIVTKLLNTGLPILFVKRNLLEEI
jgi:hypothetical protein